VQRFLGEDPEGFVGGDVNLYAYALGDPLTFIDPTGASAVGPACRGEILGGGPFAPLWRLSGAPPDLEIGSLAGRKNALLVGSTLVGYQKMHKGPVLYRTEEECKADCTHDFNDRNKECTKMPAGSKRERWRKSGCYIAPMTVYALCLRKCSDMFKKTPGETK
jgi:hypothetical protein